MDKLTPEQRRKDWFNLGIQDQRDRRVDAFWQNERKETKAGQ